MSDSSYLESSDESVGDEKETKFTRNKKIVKQENPATETDIYIDAVLSEIESSRKFRCVRGFDKEKEDEWKEAFMRASLVEEPVTEIFSGGTTHTNRSTLETYILAEEGRSCISVCKENGCRRHADRMSKLGLVCPLVSGTFYSVAAKKSMILFSLKVAVALYILDKKLETLEPRECWARFKIELQDEKEQLCYKEDGRFPQFHYLAYDNGALLKTSYTPVGKKNNLVTLCHADWCIRSVQKRSKFCSKECSIASVKQQEATSMTSNVPEFEPRGADSPGITICSEKGMNDKLPTPVSLPVFTNMDRAKLNRSKKVVNEKPPSASQMRESKAYKRIPGTTRQIFTQQSSSSESD